MKILLISNNKFLDKLPTVKFNIKKHEVTLPTFQLGKVSDYSNQKKQFLDKDINLLKTVDCLLVCNFDKGKSKNYIGPYSLILMGIAYALGRKIYLLYDIPSSKNKEEIEALGAIPLNGKLKELR